MLKHKEFAHLREMRMFPNTLNPHKEESRVLVKAMIDHVMALHEDLKWFHIGCDEVGLFWSLEVFITVARVETSAFQWCPGHVQVVFWGQEAPARASVPSVLRPEKPSMLSHSRSLGCHSY